MTDSDLRQDLFQILSIDWEAYNCCTVAESYPRDNAWFPNATQYHRAVYYRAVYYGAVG